MSNGIESGPNKMSSLDKRRAEQDGVLAAQPPVQEQTPVPVQKKPEADFADVASKARDEIEEGVKEAREGEAVEGDPKLPEEEATSLDSMMTEWGEKGDISQVSKPEVKKEIADESVEPKGSEGGTEVSEAVAVKEPDEVLEKSEPEVETKEAPKESEPVELKEAQVEASPEVKADVRSPAERLKKLKEIGKPEAKELPKEKKSSMAELEVESEEAANPEIPEL